MLIFYTAILSLKESAHSYSSRIDRGLTAGSHFIIILVMASETFDQGEILVERVWREISRATPELAVRHEFERCDYISTTEWGYYKLAEALEYKGAMFLKAHMSPWLRIREPKLWATPQIYRMEKQLVEKEDRRWYDRKYYDIRLKVDVYRWAHGVPSWNEDDAVRKNDALWIILEK
jgi:hypothetical protein